jgi:hypothetical protein
MALLKEAGWSISSVSKVEPMFSAILGLAQAWPPAVSQPRIFIQSITIVPYEHGVLWCAHAKHCESHT